MGDRSMTKTMEKPRTARVTASALSEAQRRYLQRGLDQPGGKLPLFDTQGQRIKDQTIKACIKNGWAEHWYRNPVKPDWLVCKLTDAGRSVLKAK